MNNIFAAIPADLTSEVFEVLAQSDQVKIERIVSKGHSSPETGWYDQTQHEWVIVLKGHANIEFDDQTKITLSAGDYLTIKPHQKHRVAWTAPDVETVWLAIHY